MAPMPGTVKRILAAPGTEVARGAPLLVLEAMKMEHTLRAPADGRLEALKCGRRCRGGRRRARPLRPRRGGRLQQVPMKPDHLCTVGGARAELFDWPADRAPLSTLVLARCGRCCIRVRDRGTATCSRETTGQEKVREQTTGDEQAPCKR